MSAHYVYRLFDAEGDLLYVGTSKNPWMRFRQHRMDNAHWAFEVARGRITVHPDKASALEVEAEAIRTEHPFWNISGRWIHHREWEPEHFVRWVQMLQVGRSSNVNRERVRMARLVYAVMFGEAMPPFDSRAGVDAPPSTARSGAPPSRCGLKPRPPTTGPDIAEAPGVASQGPPSSNYLPEGYDMPQNYRTCTDCIAYGEARFSVLTPALAEHAGKSGETSQQILDRYMSGVHARHLSGLPILPGGAA